MATLEGRARTRAKLENWLALISPFVRSSPDAEAVFFPNFDVFVSSLRIFIETTPFSDSELAGAFFTRTLGKTNQVNKATGSTITWNPSQGQYQATPLPAVAPFVPFTGFPEMTPEQVAAFRGAPTPEEEAVIAAGGAPAPPIQLQTDAVPVGVVKMGFPEVELRPISATTALPSSELAKTAITPPGISVQPSVRFVRALEPTENLPLQDPMAILNPSLNTTESGGSTSLPSFGGPGGTALTTSQISPEIRAGIFGDIAKGLLGAASGFLVGGPAGAAIGLGSAFIPRGGGQAGFAPPVPGQFGFPQVPLGTALPGFPLGQQFPTGLLPTPGFTGLPSAGGFQLPQNLQFLANQGLASLGTPPPFVGGGGDFGQAGAGGSFGGFPTGALPSVQFPTNGGLAATGLPIAPVIQAQSSLCFRAPKGYVVVSIVGSNGLPVKVAMWKPLATSLKLFKRRPRPLLSAADGKAIRRAERVEKKLKRLASRAGLVCRTKGRRPAARTSHRK